MLPSKAVLSGLAVVTAALLPSRVVRPSTQPHDNWPQDSVVAIHAFGRSFGESRATLRASLGPPTRTVQQAVRNRLAPTVTDTAIGVWYSGLEFSLWWFASSNQELLEIVVLTDTLISLPGGIGLRKTSPNELVDLLGIPTQRGEVSDTLTLSYLSPAPGPDEWTHFQFVLGSLRKVRWNYYID